MPPRAPFASRELGHWQPRDGDPWSLWRPGETSDLVRSRDSILLAATGFMVVRTQDVTEQVIALGFYGLVTALMFFYFRLRMSRSRK